MNWKLIMNQKIKDYLNSLRENKTEFVQESHIPKEIAGQDLKNLKEYLYSLLEEKDGLIKPHYY